MTWESGEMRLSEAQREDSLERVPNFSLDQKSLAQGPEPVWSNVDVGEVQKK